MKPTEMHGEQLFARIFCLGLLMVCFGMAPSMWAFLVPSVAFERPMFVVGAFLWF